MKTTFPNHRVDLLHGIFRILVDYTRFHFPIVNWRVLDVSDEQLDEVHLEISEDDKTWSDAVELRAYFIPEEEMFPLTNFGLEQIRNVNLQIAVPDLILSGLASMEEDTGTITLTCSIGDRFEYSGLLYDVKEIWRGEMFANTDIPIYYLASAEKVRPEADLYAGI